MTRIPKFKGMGFLTLPRTSFTYTSFTYSPMGTSAGIHTFKSKILNYIILKVSIQVLFPKKI